MADSARYNSARQKPSARQTGSARQIYVTLFVALLAPAAMLPTALAQSGSLGWLGPVLAFPVGLLVLWRVGRFGPSGLARAWRGKWLLLTIYYLWAMCLAALTMGSCVDRLDRTDYVAAPPWLLALAVVAVTAYLVCKGPEAFFRAAQIFMLALMVILALFFILGLSNLRGDNLAVRDWHEVGGLWKSGVAATAALAVGLLGGFMPRKKEPDGGSGRGAAGRHWLAGWCAVTAGLCLLVFGALGARLAAKAPLPFYLALQGIGFPGGFQRLEALGTAAWVLSDLTLLGLAALAGREMAGGRDWSIWPILAAGFFGGCFLPNATVAAIEPWIFGANLLLGVLLPVLFSLGAGGEEGISCGRK